MAESMNVDDFLKAQESESLRATIEPIEGDNSKVKITPWIPGRGCLCDSSLIIPKSAISSVSPTGEFHPCCDKLLKVVIIELNPTYQISARELLDHLMRSARQRPMQSAVASAPPDAPMSMTPAMAPPMSMTPASHEMRLPNCQSPNHDWPVGTCLGITCCGTDGNVYSYWKRHSYGWRCTNNCNL